MSRSPRHFQSGFCYHVTTRCNNREFKLTRLECREVFHRDISRHLLRAGHRHLQPDAVRDRFELTCDHNYSSECRPMQAAE